MGQRGKQPWCRAELPVGTVRLRRHSRRVKVYMVKVRLDGPKGRRWIARARWLWERAHGPVPAGMRVAHADGDPLNDSLDNLVLATPDDVLQLSAAAAGEETFWAANRAACAEGTRRFNRQRAAVRRQAAILESYWYPVDHARRQILMRPARERWQVYGYEPSANGMGYESRALGWPGVELAQACCLAVLADGGDRTSHEVVAEANALRSGRGLRPLAPGTWNTLAHALRRRGWLVTLGRVCHRGPKVHRVTRAALEARGPVSPWTAVRGADLAGERYAGHERVMPEEN